MSRYVFAIVALMQFTPGAAQIDDYVQLNDYPWSRMVSEINGVVIKKSKPVPGYVVLENHAIHFGMIRLEVADGFVQRVRLKVRKWKDFHLSEIIGLGRIDSPANLMHGGRNVQRDSSKNFRPVVITTDREVRSGFGAYQDLTDGRRLLLFSESPDTPVELMMEDNRLVVSFSGDQQLITPLYSLEANQQLKYGILTGNSIQVAFDGVHRKGLKIKALKYSYENAEHHLYEASRAIYKGNNGYAGFMLAKGAYEYLVPPEEEEVEVPISLLTGGQRKKNSFLLKVFKAVDRTWFQPADYWVMMDYVNTYALFLHTKGKHHAAQHLYEYGLQICRDYLPEDAEMTLAMKHNYALLLHETGRYWESNDLLTEVVGKLRFYKGKDHFVNSIVNNNQAMIVAKLGQLERAQAILKEAQVRAGERFPRHSPDDTRMQVNSAVLANQAGSYDQAMEGYKQALENFRNEDRAELADYNQILLLLGGLYLDMANENPEKAGSLQPFLGSIKSNIKKQHSDKHATYAQVLVMEGKYQLLNQDFRNAVSLFKEACSVYEASLGTKSYDYLACRGLLAQCHWQSGSSIKLKLGCGR